MSFGNLSVYISINFRMNKGSLEHVALEEGMSSSSIKYLQKLGHIVTPNVRGFDRALFGRGQVIARGDWPFKSVSLGKNVYWAGSDPRADGAAAGY